MKYRILTPIRHGGKRIEPPAETAPATDAPTAAAEDAGDVPTAEESGAQP